MRRQWPKHFFEKVKFEIFRQIWRNFNSKMSKTDERKKYWFNFDCQAVMDFIILVWKNAARRRLSDTGWALKGINHVPKVNK